MDRGAVIIASEVTVMAGGTNVVVDALSCQRILSPTLCSSNYGALRKVQMRNGVRDMKIQYRSAEDLLGPGTLITVVTGTLVAGGVTVVSRAGGVAVTVDVLV